MDTGISAATTRYAAARQPARTVAQRSPTVLILCLIIGVGAVVSSLLGVLSSANPVWASTTRGGLIELFGAGIYRYDTLFAGAANRGTDAITMFVALPLLVVSGWRFRNGSPRWHLVLTGVLVWFLYVYATLALAAALNPLFLVYVVIFAASLWSVGLTIRGVDFHWLRALGTRPPRRAASVFLIASGLMTAIVWCAPVLVAQFSGRTPGRLDGYTTLVTVVIDTAVIVPAAIVTGLLIWRHRVVGYLVAVPLLILEAMLAPLIVAQTISQKLSGVVLLPGEVVGPVASFIVLAITAGFILWSIIRKVPSSISIVTCAASPSRQMASESGIAARAGEAVLPLQQ